MTVALTEASRREGREQLIKTYHGDFADGSVRSEDLEEVGVLAKILDSASNLDELMGMYKAIPQTFSTLLPELPAARRLLVESAIKSYIAGTCSVLGVELPQFGRAR